MASNPSDKEEMAHDQLDSDLEKKGTNETLETPKKECISDSSRRSSKKRRAVFLDDDDELVDRNTPGTLIGRDTSSVQKAKRNLALEELKEKRRESESRKRALSFGEEIHIHLSAGVAKTSQSDAIDTESNNSSDLESELEDLSGSFINEDSESQETVQSSNSSDLVDEEDGVGSFIVEDSQSQEVDARAGPVVRDGDFIASKEVNENNSHNLYQVVGSNLNFFMMLKNRRKFIATGEYFIITEDTLGDCTGPIPVKPCASVEDHTVVEIDDELNNICSLISKNHGLKPLQLEASNRLNKQGASDLRTPSLEEAHKRFVQMTLSGIVDADFSTSLEADRVPYFDVAKEVVIKELNNGKKMVDSNAWKKEFKEMLNSCPFLKRKDLPDMIQRATCQACQLTRNLTERLMFYQQHDGEKVKPAVKKFSVGCYCADRANTYHDLQHYDFQLRQSCVEKLEKVRGMPGQETVKDVVNRCLDDEDWLAILFTAFQSHLKEAQKWTEDGNKRKEMKAHCSSFR